jgi:hypothetical protein
LDQGLTATNDPVAGTFHHFTNDDSSADATTPVVATGLTVAPAAPTTEAVSTPVLVTQQAASPVQQDVAVGLQTPALDNAASFLVYSNTGSENGSSDLSLDTLNGDSNLL